MANNFAQSWMSWPASARHPVPGRVSARRVHTHEMTVTSGHRGYDAI
jgi:hypothetical protein